MFNLLKKTPEIKAQLVNNSKQAVVTLSNINKQQTIVLLHSICKQVAIMLKVDHRFILNQLIALDKTMVKNQKEAERELEKQERRKQNEQKHQGNINA